MKKILMAVAVIGMVATMAQAQMEAVDPVEVAPVVGATYPLLWMESMRISANHTGGSVVVQITYAPYRYVTNGAGVVSNDFATGDARTLAKRVVKSYTQEQIFTDPALMQWTGTIVALAQAMAVQEGLVKP
jgi:hypothetical protein